MSKVMRTTALTDLLSRIAGEYEAKRSIFEIPEAAFREAFELEAASPGLEFMGGRVSLPVGPAAGPHSQIAPNLVAAYLAGARVFELKTVQENDRLEIAKPCIDALDEAHNTEWSTELSLDEAREEYLRGWIAINLLGSILSSSPPSFAFNMSVGYTLAGIKGAKVDAFIEGMRSPASYAPFASFWSGALRDLERFVESGPFLSAFGPEARQKARSLLSDFPGSPVHSATLSTMHGCPPDEIERIGAYLIEDKGLDVFVKLNPTLLGYDEARRILDATLWRGIEIRRESFERDLQFGQALDLVSSLRSRAAAAGRRFGIKLSNTLANANTGGFLPGDERYMSGRALFPMTIALAAQLAEGLPGWDSRFSYCGGAWSRNAGELVAAGLGPITMATDLLKPGGYLRLLPAARAAVAALPGSPDRPDDRALARLAQAALARPEYRFGWKSGRASIAKALPLFDCFAAPCVEACPVHQKVPEYIRLGAEGKTESALETIRADNPLPFITGTLCDHVCQTVCCRNDYGESVAIRSAKLAVAKGCPREIAKASGAETVSRNAPERGAARVAIVGAGPAGLSCAQHLALAGIPAVVLDEASVPGGVPANVIPRFRILREELAEDIDRIRRLGVEFRQGERVDSLESLESEGFTAFFVCAGAPKARGLEVEGDAIPVVDALDFLAAASQSSDDEASWPYGQPRHIVVAGGGNTAMDALRVALRLPGIEEARLSYRRSRDEMPADREELEKALEEGGVLMEQTLPERSYKGSEGSRLSLRVMELGGRDASGRRTPRPTERTESVACDLLVAAIGEEPDPDFLKAMGIECGPRGLPVFDPETQETPREGLYVGGDLARGPASIIAAEADGRRAAYAIMRRAGMEAPARSYAPPPADPAKLAKRGESPESLGLSSPNFLKREAERCLECDSACLRCVEVCPNRANVAIPVAIGSGGLAQGLQILHVDALCNECGNCGLFCPYEGEPFRGKPSLFSDRAAMDESHNAPEAGNPPRNAGFCFDDEGADVKPCGDGTSGPILYLRERPGAAVLELPYSEWSDEAASLVAEAGRMAALARAVFKDHRYLIGGGG